MLSVKCEFTAIYAENSTDITWLTVYFHQMHAVRDVLSVKHVTLDLCLFETVRVARKA